MQISKLTITQLSKGWASTIVDNPTTERAKILINDRLNSGFADYDRKARIYRRIPKFLKGFVNPATKVGETNFVKNV